MDTEPERSPAARKRSEAALVALLHELGDFDPPLIVLGGLVPDILTRGQDVHVPRHLGTTDVDLLIDFQVAADMNLGPIEDALDRLGFSTSQGGKHWRWLGRVGGVPIKLEFLCELEDQPAEHVVLASGCKQLGAVNLRGTGYVREDWRIEKMTWAMPDGRTITVDVRVAGLCGYLLAKSTAIRERGAEKDYYDFAYILIFNRLGGPAQAASELKDGKLKHRIQPMKTVWLEVSDRFGAPERVGPKAYAVQALLVDPAEDEFRLRQDAVSAVGEFIETLGVL